MDPAVDITLQPYAYADNDPTQKSDPTGLWTVGICLTTLLGGGGFVGGQRCIQIDGHGDLGVSLTGLTGLGTPNIGSIVGAQFSDADRIKDLRGGFKTGGGGVTYETIDVSGGYSWGRTVAIPARLCTFSI